MKSAWMMRPRSWQSLTKSRARSTVAPFLMFLRICGSPDSKPTMSRRQPASFMALRVSRSVVTREVQDQVMPRGFSLAQSSMVRAFWMLKVSSSKKNSLTWGKFSLAHFISAATSSRGALTPGVTGEGLGPEAEGALRRAAAGGVERDVGMQQEGDVVLGDVHVPLVDLGRPGHGVEVFDLRTVRGVLDDAVLVLVADAEDLVQRLVVRELDDGEVELAAADEVDDVALVERAIGVGGDGRSDERDLDGGVRLFDRLGEGVVTRPADGRGKEDQELVALRHLDGLFGADVVGRRIEELGALEHACRVGQPNRIPIGFDLAGSRPAGAGATVKVLEGGRIQKQCL